ncbi:glycosyltransferase family 2 protein [Bipolaris oryzae ATCC 44560]|uniref:Glycosyltransferase family 2 protein n=1 Tax=Bipolaris oryzae ATCC 44560 TaxID=930090 RepID=W6YWW7_COCMI|nr:glycosyltransferase family 2 protein [Bipolaris oryzae ATCC 44560]EUC40014.1 glycosyltransferase family 2 protein [Bipolaris oryzae ATCC 44560]
MRSRHAYGLFSALGSLLTWLCMHIFTNYGNPWDIFPDSIRRLCIAVFVITVVDYIWTIIWWVAYEPVPVPADEAALPNITVVIPVYNESYFIRYSLHSVLQSSYPKDRLEVVVVDDGSTDDTWKHIAAVETSYANTAVSYRTIRHERNLGKRFAIHTGFSLASGDIIISLDSDSILERNSISRLIAPLVLDNRIGGVAGHLSVLNVDQKVIPRLLDILFETSGNIPRAAQSRACSAVTILPGALSAYRTIAIKPFLASLRETTFMGTPIKHGEDIEITLGLLYAGWRTVYQSNAIVHTIAPENATRAFLMYTRWERSSYVYLLSSFSKITFPAILRQLGTQLLKDVKVNTRSYFYVDIYEEAKHLQRSSNSGATSRTSIGCLFLLINLTSTAVGNCLFPLALYAQMYMAVSRPDAILTGCFITLLLSGFRSLLFFADCSDDRKSKGKATEGEGEKGIGSLNGTNTTKQDRISMFSRKSRLSWRLQYGWLAILFHASFISWSSITALLTIRSQKWLTR